MPEVGRQLLTYHLSFLLQYTQSQTRTNIEALPKGHLYLSFQSQIIIVIIMAKQLLQPLIFASGISLFLYAHNQQLPVSAYIAPMPFWVFIGRPLGLFWNQKVLKELNRDVFPPEMRNYRELYLTSRRAIAYDIIFNHSIFNPLLATTIITYTYFARKADQQYSAEALPSRSLLDVFKSTGWSLVKIRALVSLTSIISEYWISYLTLQRSKEGMLSISAGNKRLLLIKQFILNLGWHAYLLKKVNESYLP